MIAAAPARTRLSNIHVDTTGGSMPISSVEATERQHLLHLAVATQLFTQQEAEGLLGGVLDSLHDGQLPVGHAAVAFRVDAHGPAVGWAYFAPDPYAEGVTNIWWIGVDPSAHGTGAGTALLTHVENAARSAGHRVIVIETSDQPPLARARAFYLKAGYTERGRIPDFYGTGDAKVVFSRSIMKHD
jgi:ribosomal protein S18 acetylase RimI-like enzyme